MKNVNLGQICFSLSLTLDFRYMTRAYTQHLSFRYMLRAYTHQFFRYMTCVYTKHQSRKHEGCLVTSKQEILGQNSSAMSCPSPTLSLNTSCFLTEIREAETEVHFFSVSGNDQKPASPRRSGLKQRHSQKSGGFCEPEVGVYPGMGTSNGDSSGHRAGNCPCDAVCGDDRVQFGLHLLC